MTVPHATARPTERALRLASAAAGHVNSFGPANPQFKWANDNLDSLPSPGTSRGSACNPTMTPQALNPPGVPQAVVSLRLREPASSTSGGGEDERDRDCQRARRHYGLVVAADVEPDPVDQLGRHGDRPRPAPLGDREFGMAPVEDVSEMVQRPPWALSG